MTLVVVSLAAPSVDALLDAARRARGDLAEARLDHLKTVGPDDLARLVAESPLPLLLTVRSAEEGGAFHGSEEQREALVHAAIAAKPFAVDVEAAAPFANGALEAATRAGVRVVVSAHDLTGTPPARDLVAALTEAARAGAWVGKIAVTLRGPEDAAAALDACLAARAAGLSYALMAVNDPFLRLFAPALGQALAFARPDDARATAPGQVTARELARLHARLPAPSAATRPVLLLGHPVRHSASPAMQNAAFRAAGIDAVFLAADVEAGRIGDAVRALPALGALGANVTMPYKEAVLHHVDAVGEEARTAGAANVLVVGESGVVARNTDGAGALAALHEAGFAAADAKVLLLGAGGTARAVAHALLGVGASVAVANRTEARVKELSRILPVEVVPWDADTVAHAAQKADLVVNATSVGLEDDTMPLPPAALRPGLAVLDCPYRRGGTAFARTAAAAGCIVARGESMLLHQGAASFALWTGREPPLSAMREALAAALGAAP